MKKVTPLQIYKLLDKTNCQECGKESCLEFANDLVERKVKLSHCSHIQTTLQKENLEQISQLLQPPQKEIVFGNQIQQCQIGGEEVLYRHEKTFYNQTAIAIEIHDQLENWEQIVTFISNLTITRIGEDLKIDAIALRCVSQKPDNFAKFARNVAEASNLPLILCSLSPKIIETALQSLKDYNSAIKPLIYTITPENASKLTPILQHYQLPCVVYAPNKQDLYSLLYSLEQVNLTELLIDPGIVLSQHAIAETFTNFQSIRRQIFSNQAGSWRYPLVGVPAASWNIEKNQKKEQWKDQYNEVLLGAIFQSIDTGLIILHTGRTEEEIWALLSLLTYRQNIFTDPRVYPRVDPGLTIVGTPTEWSPIYVTSNYRMTKIPVEQDLIDAGLNGYLVVVDTEGIGIESATAGGQFNEDNIFQALKKMGLFQKVKHRIVIIPGMAARLQAPLEDLIKGEVWVGPRDSSAIPEYIESHWNEAEIAVRDHNYG